MKVYTCKSISEAVNRATKVAIKWGDNNNDPTTDIWYRGVNDNYDLVPSCYWKKFLDFEESALLTFEQLVRNITDTSGFNAWDYYCLARHHGLPTRLLDWSEGFFQALFFAFDGWVSGTPCIWMIRPDCLNQLAVGLDEIFATGGKQTKPWLPELSIKKRTVDGNTFTNKFPIAVYPARSNPRVIGQLGTFTVHGTSKKPLNKIMESKGPSDSICRIDFRGIDVNQVKRELHYLGLRQAVIYPDPDHIAQDVEYMYNNK